MGLESISMPGCILNLPILALISALRKEPKMETEIVASQGDEAEKKIIFTKLESPELDFV